MWKQQVGWLSALWLAAAWVESCGAMTIETGSPDEPVIAPRRPPRLMRRDGGFSSDAATSDAAAKVEDDHS
jgi:hypothetical protein